MAETQSSRQIEAPVAFDENLRLPLGGALDGGDAAQRLPEVLRRQLAVVLAKGVPFQALEADGDGGRRLFRVESK